MPSTSRGPGRAHIASASTACTAHAGGQQPLGDEPVGLGLRTAAVVAARRHDDEVGPGVVHGLPLDPHRLLTDHTEHALASGGLDHLGDPVARGVRRVDPLQDDDARTRRGVAGGHLLADDLEARAQRGDQCLRLGAAPHGLAQRDDRGQHVVEGVRVEGQHVGRAPEVGQRLVDLGDVERADRAEVLGDHEVGVELGERAGVEVVEVRAVAHRLR